MEKGKVPPFPPLDEIFAQSVSNYIAIASTRRVSSRRHEVEEGRVVSRRTIGVGIAWRWNVYVVSHGALRIMLMKYRYYLYTGVRGDDRTTIDRVSPRLCPSSSVSSRRKEASARRQVNRAGNVPTQLDVIISTRW